MQSKRRLYHGTRYLERILATKVLRPRRIGERHVSLTTSMSVARYWARMPRDDTSGYGYVITLDRDLLEADGFRLYRFTSDWALFDEHEIVSRRIIRPVFRYILAIKRVA